MLEGLHVLLVDDSEDEVAMYHFALEGLGARVRSERSATDALEAMHAARFDVLVSDVALPNLDGYEFIREVRALAPEYNGLIPAVAVTGWSAQADRARALDAGFDRYRAKPCPPGELAAVILELVHSRPRPGAAEA